MFFDKYVLTMGGLPEPKFRSVAKKPPWNEMASGLYNEGIITVFDNNYNDSFLSSWEWLIGTNVVLLGCTCWGDFFYADMNEGEFYIVLVNQYKKFQMGNSFSAVFDMNLAAETFQKDILKLNEFALFKEEIGSLEYGNIYVRSRGKGVNETKDLSLVLDVMGQAGKQMKK